MRFEPPTSPTSATAPVPGRALRRLVAPLGKPDDAVAATRWLFARLALFSLVITVPVPIATASPAEAVVVLVAALMLGASWTIGYLRGGAGFASDVVDAVAIFGYAAVSDQPSVVFAALISALWFRSLDGSTVRAYTRPVVYGLALAGALVVWPSIGDHEGSGEVLLVLATTPILLVTVIVARRLASMLVERRQRDSIGTVYTTAVARLLGLTEDAAIAQVAGEADAALCAAVPGLRIAKVDLELAGGPELAVGGLRGEWARRPTSLPAAVLGPSVDAADDSGSRELPVSDPADLDRAAGERCRWLALSLPPVPRLGVRSWLLVGAPDRVRQPVVWALANLANYMSLAYSVAGAHEALTERASTDALTGLANRAAFTAALAAALADGERDAVSVLFVDMDDFKEINDRLGHHAGDQVLREVASRLRRASRPGDLCGRLGGDEFAVLLPGADEATAAVVARRVADAIGAPLRRAGDVAVPLSASVGAATAATGTDPEALLRQADDAMYRAKHARR